MNAITQWLDDAFCLLYPRLCMSCEIRHLPPKEVLCPTCQFRLPKPDFHLYQENDLTQRFWGRVKIHSGCSLFYFSKGSKTQRLIYNLKYQGKQKVGVILGRMLGRQLAKSPLYADVDLIIPIPLHRKKERLRGFNQSAVFAEGLSETMDIPWVKNVLIRNKFTETQTKKSAGDRFQNVLDAFEVINSEKLKGKHILLVDDVLTTGATLEAGTVKLLEIEGTTVSLATIAFAVH